MSNRSSNDKCFCSLSLGRIGSRLRLLLADYPGTAVTTATAYAEVLTIQQCKNEVGLRAGLTVIVYDPTVSPARAAELGMAAAGDATVAAPSFCASRCSN